MFHADDPTGTLQAGKVKEQLRVQLRANTAKEAATARDELAKPVKEAARPEANRLYRTVCRWWKESEVLITGAITGTVEANNTAIKNSLLSSGLHNQLPAKHEYAPGESAGVSSLELAANEIQFAQMYSARE